MKNFKNVINDEKLSPLFFDYMKSHMIFLLEKDEDPDKEDSLFSKRVFEIANENLAKAIHEKYGIEISSKEADSIVSQIIDKGYINMLKQYSVEQILDWDEGHIVEQAKQNLVDELIGNCYRQ